MRRDEILAHVPHADPDFLRIMERQPEPPARFFEMLMRQLPLLHQLFLEKRSAINVGDRGRYAELILTEKALLSRFV